MTGRRTGLLKRAARAAAWTAAGSVLCAAAFLASFYFAMRLEMRSTEVTVPDLSGLAEEDAVRAVLPLGLVVEVVDRRHDPAISSGRIIQQEPAPGSSVRRGRKLKVVASLGGEVLRVPDLVGRGARASEIELRREGLVPGGEARAFAVSSAGAILAQVPPAGSPAVPGSWVHRLVSEGPLPVRWVMPDLVGRRRDTVERWIGGCGFRRGPVRIVSAPGRTPGTVVGQLPLAGYPIPARGVVEISVAK